MGREPNDNETVNGFIVLKMAPVGSRFTAQMFDSSIESRHASGSLFASSGEIRELNMMIFAVRRDFTAMRIEQLAQRSIRKDSTSMSLPSPRWKEEPIDHGGLPYIDVARR